MAAPTYHETVIVLRKTKSGETDLILTLLASTGELVSAIAKGARKPSSAFASRLELYSCAECLFAKGRSLDIVKEARLVDGHANLRKSLTAGTAAACACEAVASSAQAGLESPRLFACLSTYLAVLDAAPEEACPVLAAAFLLKCYALIGVRPVLSRCVRCDAPTDLAHDVCREEWISVEDGGVVCSSCRTVRTYLAYPRCELAWMEALISSPFLDAAHFAVPEGVAGACLVFCQEWGKAHIGMKNKSLSLLVGL